MLHFVVLFVAALFSFNAPAALLEGVGTPAQTLEGVKIYPEAKVKIGPRTVDLKLTGAGLRKKKVVIINAKVYVAASYIDSPKGLDPKDPMKGIVASKVKALQLTLMRDLSAEKIRDSFRDSLASNQVDVKNPAIERTFAKITFDVKEGSTITLVGYEKAGGGSQVVTWELPGLTITDEAPGLADMFWKIWFGNPADGGLEKLKAELSGQKAS
jgi:hypothetical protein